MFKGQTCNGSSFLEFRRTDHPSQLPDFGGGDWAKLELSQETTVLADGSTSATSRADATARRTTTRQARAARTRARASRRRFANR